jgi:hypothetical protein
MKDAAKNNEEGNQAHEINPTCPFIRVLHEHNRSPIEAFYEEGDTET